MTRVVVWFLAFFIAPWLIVGGLIYGLYRLTLWAPGMTFAIVFVLFWIAVYKLIKAQPHGHR